MNARFFYSVAWSALIFSLVALLVNALDPIEADKYALIVSFIICIAIALAIWKIYRLFQKYDADDKVLHCDKDVEVWDFNLSLVSIPFAIILLLLFVLY